MVWINDSDVLVIADPQNDFMPGGSLAVPNGTEIFAGLNPLTHRFSHVIASQDWHPPGHMSFTERDGPWPPHCVQGTAGAELHPELDQSNIGMIVRKAYHADSEQYSAFDEFDLGRMLIGRGTTRVFIAGVATEYCVHDTAMKALDGGLDVVILLDCIRPIDVLAGDGERALEALRGSGAVTVGSSEIEYKAAS